MFGLTECLLNSITQLTQWKMSAPEPFFTCSWGMPKGMFLSKISPFHQFEQATKSAEEQQQVGKTL